MGRLPESLRRRRATVLFEGAMALVAVAVVLLAPGDAEGTASVELSRAAGTLSLANSREGAAIFQAAGMRPGEQATGSVRVTNTGSLDATLTVGPSGAPQAADAPSRLLTARLQLVVVDVTDAARPVTVYSGPLAAMGAVGTGALAAGRARDFVFLATLPAGTPADDNLVQGASLAAGFTWTATAAAPPAPTPTPTPTVTPAPAPPTTTCAPRRLRIHIRAHGRRIVKVTVKIGHRHAKRVRPRARITVRIKGAAPARVRVTATLGGGGRVVVKRRVPGC